MDVVDTFTDCLDHDPLVRPYKEGDEHSKQASSSIPERSLYFDQRAKQTLTRKVLVTDGYIKP